LREIIINSPKYGKHIVLIDDEDFELVSKYNWSLYGKDNKFYAENKSSDIYLIMHRLIMNAPPGQMIDHINGNGLDNRKENLRFCSKKENAWNQELRSDNTSGYKGVSWDKAKKKWMATIKVNYKRIFLGYYKIKEDAAIAYNNAAIKYFNEFARLNEVKNDG